MKKTAKTGRKPSADTFVLGERAFKKICAVEGIKLSEVLSSDLAHVKDLPAAERLSYLSQNTGKIDSKGRYIRLTGLI
jgi:hypothetical protein